MLLRMKVAAVLGAAVLLFSSASAAQAAPEGEVSVSGLSACPSTFACFWTSNFFEGTMGKVAGNNPDFRSLSSGSAACGFTWDDCVNSIANRGTQCTVYFYSDYNYGKSGSWHSLSRGDEVGDFAIGYGDNLFHNAISSNRWCTS